MEALSVNLPHVAERAGLPSQAGCWCAVPSWPLLMGCLQGVLCLSSAFSPGGKKPRPCSAADAIHLASWAQVCWLPGDTEAVSREDKVTLSSGRVQGVSLQGRWAVDELFLEGPGQNTNEHPPRVLPYPPTWHPRGLWAVAPSSPCLGTLVSVAFVLGDVLIVHTCPCCCALHIQPPSRSHLNVHLSSFTAILADSAAPRRCSQLHCVDCYPVQPWKKGFTSLFLHINRTKMRTEPGGPAGLGKWALEAWGVGLPVQGAGTWASLTTATPPPRVMVHAGQVAVPDIRVSCLGSGEKCLLFLLTEAVLLGGAQEQGVVVTAGKGV